MTNHYSTYPVAPPTTLLLLVITTLAQTISASELEPSSITSNSLHTSISSNQPLPTFTRRSGVFAPHRLDWTEDFRRNLPPIIGCPRAIGLLGLGWSGGICITGAGKIEPLRGCSLITQGFVGSGRGLRNLTHHAKISGFSYLLKGRACCRKIEKIHLRNK